MPEACIELGKVLALATEADLFTGQKSRRPDSLKRHVDQCVAAI